MKYINIPVFIISFLIGIFIVFMMNLNDKHTIYIYPTPENENLIQYKDRSGNCFEYTQKEVSCPVNPKSISVIPQQ
jgi:hypothetical protein